MTPSGTAPLRTLVEGRDVRVVVRAPGRLEVEPFILPPGPGPGQVRARLLSSGICGSDLHVVHGHHPFVTYPVLPGHEVLAEVLELGSEVDASWLGKRVVLEPSLPCGECSACRRGDYNICSSLQVMGFQTPGCMASRFDAPAARLHRVPAALTDEAAVLTEPTAVATHALRLALTSFGPMSGVAVNVIGAGTIGLLVALAARAHGATVTITDPSLARRQIAHDLGIRSDRDAPPNAAVAFECVGAAPALRAAITSIRKGGLVMVVGVHGQDVLVQAGLIQDHELRLQGSLMYTAEDYEEAFALLGSGAIEASKFVSVTMPLTRAAEAYAIAGRGGGVVKVVLTLERP